VPLIASMVDSAEDQLLHLAGERLACDVAAELGHLGVRVETRTVYRMQQATALPPAIVAALRGGHLDAVLLMSPDAASIWTRLAVRHELQDAVRAVRHLCLSEAVARRLAPLRGVPVESAARPTLEEMLALVDLAAANRRD
jgi:uroporphyrinogen-III synthase